MINSMGNVDKHHPKDDHHSHDHDHHDHHDHHHVDFDLKEHKKYIEISNFNTEMTAIYGFKGWHQHEHPVDPYGHIRDSSKCSLDYWYHNDPYHHKDADEPLVNTPHGYLIYEDV